MKIIEKIKLLFEHHGLEIDEIFLLKLNEKELFEFYNGTLHDYLEFPFQVLKSKKYLRTYKIFLN